METNWRVTCFRPTKQGVVCTKNSVSFAAESVADKECGVVLYDKEGNCYRFPFQKEGRRGNLYGLKIEGEGLNNCFYNYYLGDRIVTDPYAWEIQGLEAWGEKRGRKTKGFLGKRDFDWQGDEPLMIPLNESIFYGLNVRSFTMHKSSGVRNKGTFEGVAEKIPYFRELGITALELMPCYEYDECMEEQKKPAILPLSAAEPLKENSRKEEALEDQEGEKPIRLNCWGFQEGFYFAPKAAYSAGRSPVTSFKRLVRKLHQNGIEVIMQFYFPPQIGQMYMLEVIKYWVMEYHIDGVRLNGFHIPLRLIAEDAVLKNTKIWCSYVPGEELPVILNPSFKNFVTDNGNFRYDMRRFLKGDEGLINQALYYQRRNPKEHGVVNYMADYDGFSLYDSVCYERKHNEANGEDNRDGAEVNETWNCGAEGESRKKGIDQLRQRQIKNALSFVLLSQGVPFLFGGDEFACSRFGNNNSYCQDNETGWVKWRKTGFAKEILAYTKFLIRLRKSNGILHMKEELLVMDSIGCGYPDISYHGIEAWRPDLSYLSRIVGVLLCGKYSPEKGESFYIACNMHWESHELALPKLSKSKKWTKIADTFQPVGDFAEGPKESGAESGSGEERGFSINSRSIAIFRTVNVKGKPRTFSRSKRPSRN
ncbi:MAG: hypothetical protein HFI96_11000 [Lachnospiraceae bacterium]|jgi:glycogen operon protein|nr:hypothetical protein [Lachnospiraceae bacterium]